MKILVTGGAGFLGTHLCRALLKHGDNHVICIDDFSTGRFEGIKGSGVEFIYGDVTSLDIASQSLYNTKQIYNLACPASPIHYQKDPITTTMTCVLGAKNCLELAASYRGRMLQASTSEIYGDPIANPQIENQWGNVNPIGTRSCYDEGKRVAESLCFDYNRVHKLNMEAVVARIFNTYGPGMQPDDGRVVSNFIVQALQDKDITIYGKGFQTRSFCYVDDMVAGLIALMNSELKGPINLGNPDEFTVLQLANLVLELTDSKSKIIHVQLPEDDPKMRRPSIAKAKFHLGWEPKIHLLEGLKETIKYFRHVIK